MDDPWFTIIIQITGFIRGKSLGPRGPLRLPLMPIVPSSSVRKLFLFLIQSLSSGNLSHSTQYTEHWTGSMSCHVIPCHTMLHHVIPCHTMLYHVIPCYTMSYQVIPCHTMLYHVIPWNTMLYHVIPYHTMFTVLYHVIPCYTISYHVLPCYTISYHVIPIHTMLNHVIPCHTMSYHVIQCHTMLYHAIQCYTMLYHVNPNNSIVLSTIYTLKAWVSVFAFFSSYSSCLSLSFSLWGPSFDRLFGLSWNQLAN